METKEFRETIDYLQEDDNSALEYWQSFLTNLVPCIVLFDRWDDSQKLSAIEELYNLNECIGTLKAKR